MGFDPAYRGARRDAGSVGVEMQTEKAIEILWEMLEHKVPRIVAEPVIYMAIDAILQVKVFEDGERGKWTPVEAHMPEKEGYYLISRHGGIVEKDIFSDFKKGFLHEDVEAWRPLPMPYEKK